MPPLKPISKPSPAVVPQPTNGEQRKERLALSLFDTDRIEPSIRGKLLAGKLDLANPVYTDKEDPNETAVAFSCDLLTASMICDMIRSHDRLANQQPSRVYLCRGERWIKVSGSVPLTIVGPDGQCLLNKALFPIEVKTAPLVSAAARPIKVRNMLREK